MKNYILIGTIIVVTALVLGLGYFFYQNSPTSLPTTTSILEPSLIKEVKSCDFSTDCIVVDDTQHCCHCPTIINKEYLDYWNEIAVDCPSNTAMLCKCASINFAICENKICKPN